MINKILPFVLVIAVLFSFIADPVSAAESSGAYVELFDFLSANGSPSNTLAVNGHGVANFDLSTSFNSLRVYNFELVFAYTGVKPTLYSFYYGSHLLDITVTDLSSGFVKISGNANGLVQGKFVLDIRNSGSTIFNFVSFVVHTVPNNRTDIASTVSANPGTSVVLPPGGSVSVQGQVAQGVAVQDVSYNIIITESYWTAYDYIEFRSSLYCLSVSSIVCFSSSGDYFPIDHNFINSGSSSVGSWNYISGSIDLTNMDPNYEGDIYIRISALIDSTSGLYYVDGLQGIILSEPIDAQMKWYQILFRAIRNGFTSVTSTLSTEFTDLASTLNNEFTTLRTLLQTEFNTLRTNLLGWYNSRTALLTAKFDAVISNLQQLIDGQQVDDSVTDDMQQSEDDLGNMTDQMGQLSPTVNIDDVNFNIDDYVDADSTAQVTNVLTIITNQPFIVSMLSILAGFALMGYVFFGKR